MRGWHNYYYVRLIPVLPSVCMSVSRIKRCLFAHFYCGRVKGMELSRVLLPAPRIGHDSERGPGVKGTSTNFELNSSHGSSSFPG